MTCPNGAFSGHLHQNCGKIFPKKHACKQGGIHCDNIAGPVAPLGVGGRSDFSPLSSGITVGSACADPINSQDSLYEAFQGSNLSFR